ncbi:acyltransferase [Mycobacterium intracellulare]|uniref:Acyltransferase family protein n=1 Tax=Mycobacterium intracellulare 1956 TaxID=1299331 RepID=X8C9P4_MYCIT|nr:MULTISPECIES: acyltransferase [Mycobacterium]EUA53072.1 acyltransferase family protein [Mycobacterium intracellulare 1956]AGP65857.1 putative acyltransferase [Mycobacterium intracellulare subsp. yongonense 05-1390]ASW87219.1 acyltransferase [Mycobacterium intracellulare]EUA28457.1 acyltransferase family protein [Mycobacterium intracellulare]OBH67545.1 acyltransferase [Mycobacterium intracellulare]
MKLGQVFDPRRNALNAWRLALAGEVIFWHTYPIRGHLPSVRAVLQLLLCVGVDGFFAISGFLITASWISNPRLREYLAARALRILPGFYVCMIVTAFVFAPLSVAIQGGSAARLLFSFAPFEYVLKNIAVMWLKFDVGGTPHGIPNAGIWNASLWSLFWEVMCYIVVAVIGVAGLANRRWVSLTILVVAAIGASLMPPVRFPDVFHHPEGNIATTLIFMACRAAIMFAAGAFLYQWRDVIPARWSLVAVSVVIVLAAGQLPDYRVVAAIPLAYAVVVSGSLLQSKRLRLRTDLSYGMYIYAFPIQQLLLVLGLISLTPIVFCLTVAVATLPLAAASWFLVEKPARSLKSRFKGKPLASRSQAPVALPPEVSGAA